MKPPLVSIVVPTYHSAAFLEGCLRSIAKQSYPEVELIVVDNNSTDGTKEIACAFTDKVFNKGPERSAQRNFGVEKSTGVYVAIIDSDMELHPDVIKSCVVEMERDPAVQGVVVPEESFGEGWWAQCKRLEKRFYVGVDWMEAARFFRKSAVEKVGGYNETMVSGEDWDLSQRIGLMGRIVRIAQFIRHNEGRISLLKTIRKKFHYARKFARYVGSNKGEQNLSKQTGIRHRYALFLSRPGTLFRNPLLGLSLLFMKTCEFGVGGAGYVMEKMRSHEKHTG